MQHLKHALLAFCLALSATLLPIESAATTIIPVFSGTVRLTADQLNDYNITVQGNVLSGGALIWPKGLVGEWNITNSANATITVGYREQAAPVSIASNATQVIYGNGTGLFASASGGGGGSGTVATGVIGQPAIYTGATAVGGLSNGASAQTFLSYLTGQPAYYAANYGVKMNGISLTDFTTIASSATVSSASYTFTSVDVGKTMSIWAGTSFTITATLGSNSYILTSPSAVTNIRTYQRIVGSGIQAGTYVQGIVNNTIIMSKPATGAGSQTLTFVSALNTTISNVSNGSAVLAATAGTSISGVAQATFGTDDTANFNALLTTIKLTLFGGNIVMPNGIAMVTGALQWGSNVSMTGAGLGSRRLSRIYWASPNQMASGSNPAIFQMPAGSSYVTPNENVFLSNFELDMDTATKDSTAVGNCMGAIGGGNGSYMKNGYVDNVYAHGSPATCWGIGPAQNFGIKNSFMAHNARLSDGGAGHGGGDVGVGLGEIPGVYESFYFTNNQVYDPGPFVVLDLPVVNGTNSLTDTALISNNVITLDSYSNIATAGYMIQDGGLNGAVITDNTITAPPPPAGQTNWIGIGTGCGDFVVGFTCTTVTTVGFAENGIMTGNTVTGMSSGFELNGPNTKNYKISGNVVYGGGTSTGSASCITISPVSAGMANLEVSNNKLYNCGYSGVRYLGSIYTGSNISITGNTIGDCGLNSSASSTQKSAVSTSANTLISGLSVSNNIAFDDGPGTCVNGFNSDPGSVVTNLNIGLNNFSGVAGAQYNALGTLSGVASPTLSSCGTSPSIDAFSNNYSGKVTVGSTATSCTLTFAGTPYSQKDHCTVTLQNASVAGSYSYTASAITVTASALGGAVWDYKCDGF